MKSFSDRKAWILAFIQNHGHVSSSLIPVSSFSKDFVDAYVAFSGAVANPSYNGGKVKWCRTLSQDLSKMFKLGFFTRYKVYDDVGWHYQYFWTRKTY